VLVNGAHERFRQTGFIDQRGDRLLAHGGFGAGIGGAWVKRSLDAVL
jgi:hypothetical protein